MKGHPAAIREGMTSLLAREDGFARLIADAGHPPPRKRPPGFATLLQIIIGQQVSTDAAAAIWARLQSAADPVTPEVLLALGEDGLRAVGFSRPKITYARDLARQILDGTVDLSRLKRMDDDDAVAMLVGIKGIGRWSAEIYLLFAHGRPDIWPADDLAIAGAYQHLRGLDQRPDGRALRPLGEAFRPWRSAAAILLWHLYRHRVRAGNANVVPG